MQDLSVTARALKAYQDNSSLPKASLPSRILTYISFNSIATRIGLEISLCFLVFTFFQVCFPWAELGLNMIWVNLVSWFTACFSVVIFDVMFLSRPVNTYKRAYVYGLSGAHEKALKVLEMVSPFNKQLYKCPLKLYHLLRAEVFIQAGNYNSAEREIVFAEYAGASKEETSLLRCKMLKSMNHLDSFTHAMSEITQAKDSIGETAILCLEEGLLLLEEHKDLWKAKKTLKRVATDMKPERHFYGENTDEIAKAGLEATKLWTGEAEEGLIGLTQAIDKLRSSSFYNETLRPVLSLLYLERAHYLATHKQPTAACFDLRMALTICSHSNLRKKAFMIQEELLNRYQMLMPI